MSQFNLIDNPESLLMQFTTMMLKVLARGPKGLLTLKRC